MRDYIQSLKEDGELDWVIANIGIAKGWSVLRLPFIRREDGKIKQKKAEPEFGIDLSFFVDDEKRELVIIVLKDEKLTSTTWKSHRIQNDLNDAKDVLLDRRPYATVEKLTLVLAYNKDENAAGLTSYDNFVGSNPVNLSRGLRNPVEISHERWNLERICEEIEANVFTADILPRQFSGGLHYLCSQIKDFSFGTTQWEQITQPTWRQLLKSIMGIENTDRALLTLNFCLSLIKREFDLKSSSSRISPGYIDLYEIALLAAAARCKGKVAMYHQTRVEYFTVLHDYFSENVAVLKCPDAFDQASFLGLTAVRSAHLAFWNIGRLCLFIHLMIELRAELSNQELESVFQVEIDSWIDLLNLTCVNNDAIFRPLIDLHHIELYLIWSAFLHKSKIPYIRTWLRKLTEFLAVRRNLNQIWKLPFIESYNRMDLVAEFAVTQQRPIGFTDQTSYLVMMLIELGSVLPPEQHREIVTDIVSSIVMPSSRKKAKRETEEQLKLVSWTPPANWATEILSGGMGREGTLRVVGCYGDTAEEIADELIDTVRNAQLQGDTPSVFGESPVMQILASIRFQSPLPPYFWRRGNKAQEFS